MEIVATLSNIFTKQDELDLTTVDIKTAVFYLALPLVITNLLQTAYNLADTIWVGQYSTEALAALSFAYPLYFLFLTLGIGLSIAGSVLIAQRIGENDKHGAELAASQTVLYAFISSILIGIICFYTVDNILALFGADPTVKKLGTQYMRIISIGFVSYFGFTTFSALSRGTGDAVTPMLLLTGTITLNIIIDPIFIFGFTNNPLFIWLNLTPLQDTLYTLTHYTGNGIKGAAYATVLCRTLAFTIGLYLMLGTTRTINIHPTQFKPQYTELKQLIRIGGPATASTLTRSLSVNLMLFIVGLFPTAIIAGYGVGIRIFSLIYLPAIAVGQAVETITGQNYGANNPTRIHKTNTFAVKAMFTILTTLGILTLIAAKPIATIFTDDPHVLTIAYTFITIVAPTFGFTGILRAYAGGLRGVGRTELAALISIITLAITRLPLAYILSQHLNYNAQGIWYAFAISNILGGITAYTLFTYLINKLK